MGQDFDMKTKYIIFLTGALMMFSIARAEDAVPAGKDTPKSPKNTANKIVGMPLKGKDTGNNKLFGVADGLFKTKKGKAEEKSAEKPADQKSK